MNDTNKKRYKLLGVPYGTAANQLRKMIIFDFAKKFNMDICYRCGEKIENLKDFSIEHKEAWMQAKDPKEAFYNLDNIAFSHFICNAGATIQNGPNGEKHPNHKLTAEQVIEIRKNYHRGKLFIN